MERMADKIYKKWWCTPLPFLCYPKKTGGGSQQPPHPIRARVKIVIASFNSDFKHYGMPILITCLVDIGMEVDISMSLSHITYFGHYWLWDIDACLINLIKQLDFDDFDSPCQLYLQEM